MKCDECGRQFPGTQASQTHRYERYGDEGGKIVFMTICQTCAAKRVTTLWWFVWFFVALLVGGLIFVTLATRVFL
jgi:hypothetical protein